MTDNKKIDVFMPTVFKDMNKVEYSIRSLIKYFPRLNNIHISMPNKGNQPNVKIDGHIIYFHNDLDILPTVNLNNCRFRPNWILQQLLKLCQNVTETKYTLIFDSDCILVNKFDVIDENGRPKIIIEENKEGESAYLRFISKMSNGEICDYLEEEYALTKYIADLQLFDKDIINEMIHKYFNSKEEFIDYTINTTFWKNYNRITSIFISEYELYGRYVEKFHKNEVVFENISHKIIVRNQASQMQQLFSNKEIESEIELASKEGVKILKLQSKCGNIDINGWAKTK